MIKKYKVIKTFHPITKFRITNALLVMFGIHLILPVLIDMRGELLSTTFISMIMIATTLAMKTNKYFVENYNFSQLYKMGVFIHFIFFIGGFLYFINPMLFVIVDSLLSVLETSILMSYSIKLDVYQAKHIPAEVEPFKIFRNSSVADVTLLSLGLVTIITSLFQRDIAVYIFLGFNFFVSIRLFSNWKFFDKYFEKN